MIRNDMDGADDGVNSWFSSVGDKKKVSKSHNVLLHRGHLLFDGS